MADPIVNLEPQPLFPYMKWSAQGSVQERSPVLLHAGSRCHSPFYQLPPAAGRRSAQIGVDLVG